MPRDPRIADLSQPARDVLARAWTSGPLLQLPEGAIPRPLYNEIAGALERLNGRWSRKYNAHHFPGDARQALNLLLNTERCGIDATTLQ